MFRTQDNSENRTAFGSETNNHGESSYPQIRMCCLMKLSSHLIINSEFDARHVGEMTLAQRLINSVPDNSLTQFDRGYYSVGLLYEWQNSGQHTYWMLPARKYLQFEVIRQLSEHDAIVALSPSPQASKKFANLPTQVEARLTTYKPMERHIGY
ncbi:transposase [Paraglaciecola sp.]|uniref:transposase n=1 Tax=Paraglaciecola sp. TaxID=1920173 RepID=UPI0030F45D37